MTDPIFFDTETTGLYGPVVLIQYAQGDNPVTLYSVWKEPISDTLELIEWIASNPGGIVGFNLAFDHFHLCQLYTTLSRLPDPSLTPEDCIEEYALAEPGARNGDCLKPVSACDLMLVAKRGPYQSTMARRPIKIRRVPTVLAHGLAQELEQRVTLKELYFSRRKNKNLPKWQVRDCNERDSDKIDPHFKDIVLDFKASSALKVIANDLLGEDRYGRERSIFSEIAIDRKYNPAELGYCPFALAIAKPPTWRVSKLHALRELRGKRAWPGVIEHHIRHWHFDTLARRYAEDDVKDTRGIWKAFDCPEPGDVDSDLACMVGAVRWKGFAIDAEKIKELRKKAIERAQSAPRSPREVKEFLAPVMTPMERLAFKSTKKMVLEEIEKTWEEDCPDCDGEACSKCKGSGGVRHKAADRAELVLAARKAKKDIEVYDKLLLAGRFHFSANVIGALSGRMSGTDGLNPHAMRNEKFFRSCFPLQWPGTVLCGGDFVAFEVALAEADYNDTKLREQLQSYTECYKCGGTDSKCEDCHGSNRAKVKIHALFGTMCFPTMTYEEICKNKIVYTRSKSGFFSQIYGGNYATLMTRLGVDEKSAMEAEARFANTYEGVKRARQKIFDDFCSLRQPAGIGTHVEWHEPVDLIENMLDPPFKRYFVLENMICKALFDLASNPPNYWRDFRNIKVWRRDREQTAGGAVQSALYGAAFQIQAGAMRAACNHRIQSTGAEICKSVQNEVWKLQPSGVNRWMVQPMSVHDEIQCVIDPTLIELVEKTVRDKVEEFRPLVPLLDIEWHNNMGSWAEK